MLLRQGSQLLAALSLLFTDFDHAGHRFAAGGLSAVVTHPAHRDRGHGRQLVRAARQQLAGAGVDLAVFTCDRPLAPFYLGAGWTLFEATVLIGGTVQDPFGSDQFDKLTFGALFSPAAVAAAGSLIGGRIALYPGAIDRLW